MRQTPPRVHTFVPVLVLALMLTGCDSGEDEDSGDLHEPEPVTQYAHLELQLEPEPAAEMADPIPQVIDQHFCTDERERVLDEVSQYDYQAAVPLNWDGATPFRVYISASLPDPYDLLAAVAAEAERIHEHLGYEIFVAGDVIEMEDIAYSDVNILHYQGPGVVADYEIPIYCCDDRPGKAGHAQILTRKSCFHRILGLRVMSSSMSCTTCSAFTIQAHRIVSKRAACSTAGACPPSKNQSWALTAASQRTRQPSTWLV